jgi:hypothetical protein
LALVDISNQAVVWHALVIERRQHQRGGEAAFCRMAGQGDRIGQRGGAGADHAAVERQPGLRIGGHDALTLHERERGRLAGGAEHVEAVAAIVEEIAGERGRTGAVGLAASVGGGGDGGDDAANALCHRRPFMRADAGRRLC